MMKKLNILLCLSLLSLMASGCASLNYNEVVPNARSYTPTVVVVLPSIKMPEGADQEADKVAKAIYDAAVATERFERVIDPVTAKSQMEANSQLQDAVINYTQKLRALAVSDKESCRKIGEIFQADTVIVAEVGKWGYFTISDEKAGEVGLALKMVDVATGSIYWKAAHAAKETYHLFKPDLGKMALELAEKMFGFMPKTSARSAPAVPAPAVPAPAVPAPAVPAPAVPAPAVPAPAVPAPAVPAPAVPAPAVPVPAVPVPAVPAPSVPAPSVPVPAVPAPSVPAPAAPAPAVPVPAVPAPAVPAPAAPAPAVPAPSVPAPAVPAPVAPAPEVPAPEVPVPDAPVPDAPTPAAP